MLTRLDLPILRVPAAPTRPQESGTTPVSIGDYLAYCRLRQEEIDVDVLGSSNPYRDIKRRFVFRILYGSYDAQVAVLQQELRATESELRSLQQGEKAFEHFLEDTALANRASVERRLTDATARLQAIEERRRTLAAAAQKTTEASALRAEIARLDVKIAERLAEAETEETAASQLREFINQLQTQSGRLTRAVVAGDVLHDFDFVVCPRCGLAVSQDRAAQSICYVCLQEPSAGARKDDLLREQVRIEAQIKETEDLVSNHLARSSTAASERAQLRERRQDVGRRLDEYLSGFVSDRASAIEDAARCSSHDGC